MKVAYLCPDVSTSHHGMAAAGLRVRGLVQSLLRLGHDVRVFTPRGGRAAIGFDVPVTELRVEPFEERTAESLASDPNLGPAAASEARSLYATILRRRGEAQIRDFAPDLVFERSSLFGGAGLAVARRLHVPIIVDVVAPVVDPGATGPARLRPVWIRNADHLIAATAELGAWLRGVVDGESRVTVLTGGLDTAPYEHTSERSDSARERLGVHGKHVVGYVGPLDGRYDLEPIVLALGLLDKAGIDPHLLIVGDGAQRDFLQKLVRAVGLADLVSFVDMPPAEELPATIAALDAFVTPSSDESLELLGSLAAARPVAAPDTGGHHHCLQAGKTAWLYPPADPGTLAVTLGMILRNPSWAAELAGAGRDHVREHHSWDEDARAFVELTHGGNQVSPMNPLLNG